MDTLKLLEVLAKVKGAIQGARIIRDFRKGALVRKVSDLEERYKDLDIPDDFSDLYQSLMKRGNELLKEFRKKNEKELITKIRYYLRYVTAAVYDFTGDTRGLHQYSRFFIIMAALFMVLVPQFYGFVLPLVFVIPIFAGIRGLRNRSYTAFTMTLAVIPMAVMVGITWIQYFIRISSDLPKEIAGMASRLHTSLLISQILVFGPVLLGVVLLLIALYTGYVGYKTKDMFV